MNKRQIIPADVSTTRAAAQHIAFCAAVKGADGRDVPCLPDHDQLAPPPILRATYRAALRTLAKNHGLKLVRRAA